MSWQYATKRYRMIVLASILCFVLVQCSLAPASSPTAAPGAAGTSPAAPRGGIVTIASAADAMTLQPLLSMDVASNTWISYIYDSLFVIDVRQKAALVPQMAESYHFSEDGLTLTITLRRDLVWSDGKPLTAEDVVFTYEAKRNLPASQSLRDTFSFVRAQDTYTIVYSLPKPNCVALHEANIPVLPRHVFAGLDVTNNPHNTKPSVSSGPFLLQEWVKDDHATFVANDRYYRGRPNLDKLIVRIITDQTVATALLKTQEVDHAGVLATDWDSIRALPFLSAMESYWSFVVYEYLSVRVDNPILRDLRVRQALAYALDRQSIVDSVYGGHARVASGFAIDNHWVYTEDTVDYGYDPDKARALLQDAGWTAGPGGILVKDGKPLKLRLHYISSFEAFEQIAVIAQEQLSRVGISLEVIAEEYGANIHRLTQTHDYDLIIMVRGDFDPSGALSMYTSADSVLGYSNPEIDRLWAEGAAVPGCRIEDRQKVYAQAQRILSEDLPAIFLLVYAQLGAMNARVDVGWEPETGYMRPIEQWYIKPGR